MALSVLNITPSNGTINIEIDSKIALQFDQPVDEFTIPYGIALYVIKDANWTGPNLSVLDNEWTDVNSTGSDYVYIPITYSVEGNTVTIEPESTLYPDRTHYLSIVPGDDAKRYLSTKTTSDPIYTRIGSSTGTISAAGPYTGTANGSYTLQFTSPTKFSVTFNSVYVSDFVLASEVNLGALTVKLDGEFEAGDIIDIDVFKASGTDVLYKAEFTTSKYTTVTPGSTEVPSSGLVSDVLRIVDTIPETFSVDNATCNPIVLKFNRPLKPTQDIKSKIKLTKTDMISGKKRYVDYEYVISGNILKLYLKSVGNPVIQ